MSMSSESSGYGSNESETPVDHIIADYLEAIERGEMPDPQAYLDRYPHFATELGQFFQAAFEFRLIARGAWSMPSQTLSTPEDSSASENQTTNLENSVGASSVEAHATETAKETRYGEFTVLNEIARGGMGVVFQGRDLDLKREIAIKALLTHHLDKIDLRQRFIEEAQIAAQLQHPGITPVYELGNLSDGRPYFTMKLVKGETLSRLLTECSDLLRDRQRFLNIFEQVCQTLAYAHSRGVIHRDLKPSNIMVGAFGEVQVMDWGMAKVLSEAGTSQSLPINSIAIRTVRSPDPEDATGSGSETQYGSVLGTLAYMPPEQAIGKHLDRRADVFGLGAILCEILTGNPPYVASSFEELRRKAVRAELTEAFNQLDHCDADEELVRLARRALAPEPGDRHADAGVVAKEMTHYREGVELRARVAEIAEAQATTRAIEERSRRKLAMKLSGALITVLAIGVLGTTWGLVSAKNALLAEIKAKESERRELFAADLLLANQMWESENGAAKNVDSFLMRHVPALGTTDLREFAWRLQWTELNRNSLALYGHTGGARLAAFLPNGHFATLDGTLTLRRFELPNGKKLMETTLPGTLPVSCSAISKNGEMIAVGHSNEVLVIDTLTGHTLYSHPGQSLALSFSSDSSRLVAVMKEGTVQVLEIAMEKKSRSFHFMHPALVVQHPERLSDLEGIELAPNGKSIFLLGYPSHDAVTEMTIGGTEWLLPMESHSSVYSMAITPDGIWKATGNANGQVCLSNGPTILELPLHIGDVSALGFSASSRWLATGGTDGMVKLWDVTNRTLMYSLKGHLGCINSVRFASDERTVASASDDGTTRVWNLPPNRSPQVFGLHNQSIFSLAYSPDGKYLAVGTGNPSVLPTENDNVSDSLGGFVHIWEITSGELVRTFRADDWRVLVLAFTTMGPDRSRLRLITGGYDSRLKVWDALTEGEPLIMKGLSSVNLKSAIGALAVSPNGNFLAAGFGIPTYRQQDYPQIVKIWNLRTGFEVARLNGHSNTICGIAFSPDGRLLATAGDDHKVILWSTKNWKPLDVRTQQGKDRIKCVAFSKDGQSIVAGDASGIVTIWNTESGSRTHLLRGHADAVFRLAFSPDGRTLATASWDNTVKLWDPVSGRETRTLRDHERQHENWISSLAFSPDGNSLVTGSLDAKIRMWNTIATHEISTIVTDERTRIDQ